MKMNIAGGERPIMGEYEYPPLRTLALRGTLPLAKITTALQGWAKEIGYKFYTTSPAQEPGSILIEIWKDQLILLGLDTLGGPGLEFVVYWNGDTADDRAIDAAVEQLRTRLAVFGPVEVVSAPPGTPPRVKSRFRGGH